MKSIHLATIHKPHQSMHTNERKYHVWQTLRRHHWKVLPPDWNWMDSFEWEQITLIQTISLLGINIVRIRITYKESTSEKFILSQPSMDIGIVLWRNSPVAVWYCAFTINENTTHMLNTVPDKRPCQWNQSRENIPKFYLQHFNWIIPKWLILTLMLVHGQNNPSVNTPNFAPVVIFVTAFRSWNVTGNASTNVLLSAQ